MQAVRFSILSILVSVIPSQSFKLFGFAHVQPITSLLHCLFAGGSIVVVHKPDGRVCRLCPAKDSDQDLVDVNLLWKWGYPCNTDGSTQGKVCFYCVRVFNARYQYKFSITTLQTELGSSTDTRKVFNQYLEFCKNKFVLAGTHDLKVNWEEVVVITQTDRTLVSFEEPDDQFWKLEKYKLLFGDPASNGKGHAKVVMNGMDGVLVPTDGPYLVKRSHQKFVDKARTIDDGSFDLGEGQADQIFGDISEQLFATRATGMSLSSLVGSAVLAPASASSSSGLAFVSPSKVRPNDEQDESFARFGFGGPSPVKALVEVGVPVPAGRGVRAGRGAGRGAGGRGGGRGVARAAAPSKSTATVKVEKVDAGDASKRGRPKRDLQKIADGVMEEFQMLSETSDLYFGEEWKQQRRWLERLIGDLQIGAIAGETQTCRGQVGSVSC